MRRHGPVRACARALVHVCRVVGERAGNSINYRVAVDFFDAINDDLGCVTGCVAGS